MPPETDLRTVQQWVIHSLSQLSSENLLLIANFVSFLQQQSSPPASSQPKQASLADLLEVAGSWEGNDLRDCLQLVHESRAPLEF